MYAYEICPGCGGLKWIQVPDTDYDAGSSTNATMMKGCTCPLKPKPKIELGITVLCPNCKGCVTINIRGLPAEDIYSTFFDRGEEE